MTLRMTIKEVRTGKLWDVSDLLLNGFRIDTELAGSFPGRLNFSLLDDGKINFKNGDIVELTISSKKMFKGTIRRRSASQRSTLKFTAYDSKFLLKSKETRVFNVATASSRFSQVCAIGNIPHKIKQGSSYNCVEYVAEAKSFNEIIKEALEQTRKATNQRYAVVDNYGTLEFISLNSLVSNLIIGDKSLLTSYDFESSAENVLNSIKVIREDSETKAREVALARDNTSIKTFGLLQDIQSPKESDMNKAQMQEQANNELKEHKNETRTLTLDCLGDLNIKSGSTVTLQISKLKSEGLYNKKALVTHCSHYFDAVHTMSLEVEVR